MQLSKIWMQKTSLILMMRMINLYQLILLIWSAFKTRINLMSNKISQIDSNFWKKVDWFNYNLKNQFQNFTTKARLYSRIYCILVIHKSYSPPFLSSKCWRNSTASRAQFIKIILQIIFSFKIFQKKTKSLITL